MDVGGARQARSGRLQRSVVRLRPLGPGGPFERRRWRSPLRGPWLTSVFGAVLLVTLPLVILTALVSYAAYDPAPGGSNDQTPSFGTWIWTIRW